MKIQRFWSYEAQNIRCVREEDFDAAQSELAALREELANHDSATLLINAWCAEHKSQMPWDKAIELIAVVTKMPDAEKQRLLCLDDQYELQQQRLTAAEQRNAELTSALTRAKLWVEDRRRFGDDGTVAEDWLMIMRTLKGQPHPPTEFDKPTESGASE